MIKVSVNLQSYCKGWSSLNLFGKVSFVFVLLLRQSVLYFFWQACNLILDF